MTGLIKQAMNSLKRGLSTRELILSSQTAFWHAKTDTEKIVLVEFLAGLLKDLPAEKRPPFIKQITSSLGSLITPIDDDGLYQSDDDEETSDSKRPKKGELDLKVSNQSPEGILEKEERLRKSRDKLLIAFLPTILNFFESLIVEGEWFFFGSNTEKATRRSFQMSHCNLSSTISLTSYQTSRNFTLTRAK